MPYAHPEALVAHRMAGRAISTTRISGSSTAPSSCRAITPTAREDYDRGHIPGAVFFDIDDIAERRHSLPHMIPSPESLCAARCGALGIGDGDGSWSMTAPGCLRPDAPGGCCASSGIATSRSSTAACRNGRRRAVPLDRGRAERRRERHFTARFDPALVRDKRALIDNLSTRHEQVVDARAAGRFDGTAKKPGPACAAAIFRAAATSPTTRVTDPSTRQLRSAEELSRAVSRCRGGARPPDRDQLRLRRHRLRAGLRAST